MNTTKESFAFVIRKGTFDNYNFSQKNSAGNSAGRLFSKKNKEAAGRRCLFPSPVRRLGIQDAVLDGFRGVVFSQGFKPNSTPGTRKNQRRVLSIEPEGISLFFQHPQELLPCEGSGNRFFDIFLDGRFPCVGTVLLGQPQGIRDVYKRQVKRMFG